MKRELEALDRASETASELEIHLAELAQSLSGDAQTAALHLRDEADKLADTLTAIYLELARAEAAQTQTVEATSVEQESGNQ
ncbi:MAG: hypothetical protein ACR2LC_04585 [Pyrinomonadaceae bacterium]